MMIGGMVLALIALGCGQVRSESNELRFKLQGTAVVSGGHEEGGCGAPWAEGRAIYMLEPARKFEATYRVRKDDRNRTWLKDETSGCTMEVRSLDEIQGNGVVCEIEEGSPLSAWGNYERIYSHMEVNLEDGTFRASERSLVIDNTQEKGETCSVAEGRAEKL